MVRMGIKIVRKSFSNEALEIHLGMIFAATMGIVIGVCASMVISESKEVWIASFFTAMVVMLSMLIWIIANSYKVKSKG